jgi:hypothetical protein
MTCSITPPDGCLELVHRIEPILDPVSCTARDTNIKAHSVLLFQVRVSSVARCEVCFGKGNKLTLCCFFKWGSLLWLVAKSVLGNLPWCLHSSSVLLWCWWVRLSSLQRTGLGAGECEKRPRTGSGRPEAFRTIWFAWPSDLRAEFHPFPLCFPWPTSACH